MKLTPRRVARRLLRRRVNDYMGWHDDSRITMGRYSYGQPEVITYRSSEYVVEVGSFCSIAADVRFFLDGEHRIDLITTSPLETFGLRAPPGHNRGRGPITIGHDVWIGRGATILSGVTIGTGAVVGACAVVAKDVDPYTIVVGNPARPVRRRFSAEDCEALLATKWWELPDESIRELSHLLQSADVAGFVAAVEAKHRTPCS